MSQPRAYSYIRFSTEKQTLGDSLTRQLKLAEKYAEDHNLTLDTHSYRDLGVSAFQGKNAVEGKLGTFIKAVDNGIIKPGSFLLVESLDRLSRNDVDEALLLFMSIINKGITIVTLADSQEYSSKKIKEDRGISLIISITIMIRANEESATKSMRAKAAWARKAERGDTLTTICPGWMKHNGEKFVLLEDRANTVRRMFEMSLGGHGTPKIASELNDKGIKPFGWAEFWTNGTIASVLNNPATYGTLRRKQAHLESVPNYYPAAIPEDVFVRAHAAATSRHKKGGRKGIAVKNLFAGMSHCGRCGSKMRIVSTRGNTAFLRCLKSLSTKDCDAKSVSMQRVEETILYRLIHEQGRNLLLVTQMEAIDPTADLRAELLENQAKLDNLIKLAEITNDISAIATKINSFQSTITKLQTKIKNTVSEPLTNTREVDAAIDLRYQLANDKLSDEKRSELRTKLQGSIRRIITRIDVLDEEEKVRVTFASGKVRELRLDKIEIVRERGEGGRFVKEA